ncbi:MAG: alkylphosphonate utilization protein [Pontiellaceae bacterium]|nr:alkylphosphonate utilization protein [Pontiellaceae bacterium]MBN2784774.1 alkylphosphonate utilization protein [Pontiellaceae bacterium]
MSDLPNCPKCDSEYCYENQDLLACPDCGHEWNPADEAEENTADELIVKDSVGNVLQDGDDITIIKDLKVKGASQPLKVGTKVKGIRLVDGDHNIDCKIPGFGSMSLKSEFVKKA